jgi:hypothetical protein
MKISVWISGIIFGAAICVSVANVSAQTTAAIYFASYRKQGGEMWFDRIQE